MEKSKIVAAVLAFLLGGLGIHKFYLGKTKAGVIHIALGVGGYVLAFIGISAVFAAGMSGSGGGSAVGIIILLIGFLAAAANGVICLIETVLYLIKSDQEFNRIYVAGDKSWF